MVGKKKEGKTMIKRIKLSNNQLKKLAKLFPLKPSEWNYLNKCNKNKFSTMEKTKNRML